jgi:hypothetical protein
MKIRRRSNDDPRTNADLRRFAQIANKRYFRGVVPIVKITFSARLGSHCHGKFETWIYESASDPNVEFERYHILINSRLRRWRDLCMITVYHEMVHAELDMQGARGKSNSCRKSGEQFNRRMAELTQAGAFNGLW